MCSSVEIHNAYYQLIKIAKLIDDNRKTFQNWQDYEKAVNQVIDIDKISKCLNASKTRLLREWYEFILLNKALTFSKSLWTYNNLVLLYYNQVSLPRTSKNQELDQFSTPLPIAFLLGQWTYNSIAFREKGQHYILDPTAGNGLLMNYFLMLSVINNDITVCLNEIDNVRFKNLEMLAEFNEELNIELSHKDFFDFIYDTNKQFDAILINPPFYRVKKPFTVYYPEGNIKFHSQDFAFVLKTLEKLHPDGRAVCIIGGHIFGEVEQSTYWDSKGRPKSGEERAFWLLLYRMYNVVDVIYVDGKKLWQKQGQATNLRIILIDGKRKNYNKEIYPPLYAPDWDKLLDDHTELLSRLLKTDNNLYQLIEKIKLK